MNTITSPFLLHSRSHGLNAFPDSDSYVKRDDELSFGISGSKYRKYAHLMPHLLEKGFKQLVVIAGANSNNLLAALQMGAEFGLKVIPFLLKPHRLEKKGNFLYSSLFLKEGDVQWVSRHKWREVESLAKEFIKTEELKTYLLPEGAFCQPALNGAKTLADSIKRNENELSLNFQHIFIDAGTGLSAIGLLLRLKELKHPAKLHVLTLADSVDVFYEKLELEAKGVSFNLEVFSSITAKSFGAVNQAVRKEIQTVAKEEGIVLDPIYSSKLFLNAREKIQNQHLEGAKLIIHSGGALSVSGMTSE